MSDVKLSNDNKYIFSASHDGKANIYSADSLDRVSKLGKCICNCIYILLTSIPKAFHQGPLNQIAVNPSLNEYSLATCSSDGSATIWVLGESCKDGEGITCEIKEKNAHIECIEFGSHSTKNLLFLGVENSTNHDYPGFV